MTQPISIETIAREMADEYGIDLAAARADVKYYAGQISDTADLYDVDGGDALTEEGAELVRLQTADVYA